MFTHRVALGSHPDKISDTLLETPLMTTENIDKWISGETHVFFDPHSELHSVTADSNPGMERSTTRQSIRKLAHPIIAMVVGVFTFVVLACFVISARHYMIPLPAAGAKSLPSERVAPSRHSVVSLPPAETKPRPPDPGETFKKARAMGGGWSTPVLPTPGQVVQVLAGPIPNQLTTTLSDTQLAAFLREAGLWYDLRMKAAPGAE